MSKVIKLGNYKGIEFKVEKVPVSNEEVEQQIQMILAQSSQTEEKDGDTVENGDIATIDFVGLKDDVAFEGGTGNDYDLEIGSGSFIPGFEEQMIGMKVNETRDLNLTFPENYQAEDLAGQDVVFKVTVKKLSVKKEAELNDDFVEGLGVPEIKTVEDLKAYINEGLQQQHDQQYEAQKENTIFDAFMADSIRQCSILLCRSAVRKSFHNSFAHILSFAHKVASVYLGYHRAVKISRKLYRFFLLVFYVAFIKDKTAKRSISTAFEIFHRHCDVCGGIYRHTLA